MLHSESYAHATCQVLNSLSKGGTNLNNVDVTVWCMILVGLALIWRVIHFLALARSIA